MAGPPPDLLRFITCGSVDDGKSTLIGRLLFDAGAIADDQLAALPKDAEGRPDLAMLVDGLAAEREQGITIDVAYRYFSTPKRRFIVADTPGHEQYTRNMATGASTADLAVVLVDARKGVLPQTRRHACIVALMGVRSVVLAVTKMDLVGWDQETFETTVAAFASAAERLGLSPVTPIPVSGRSGENVARRGGYTPWHTGPTLLEVLETAPVGGQDDSAAFRMPVQLVARPHLDFRGYAGRVVSGRIARGDPVRIAPSNRVTAVERIVVMGRDLDAARVGQSVVLTLQDQVDVSRGDVVVTADRPLEAADQFAANIVWMAEEPLPPGRLYMLKIGARTIGAQVTDIRHKLNVETLDPLPARTLALNDIGLCHLSLGEEVPFAPYAENRELGGFILIDRQTNATVGAGMILHALRRAHNVHRQSLTVGRTDRAAAKGQKPAVVWFTGLSGSGKSTIANAVEARLLAEGRHAYLIDGDNLRHGLSRDLGFTEADRVENVRRAAETAKLMADAGLIVLVSLISPFAAERRLARELLPDGEFFEVHVDAPLHVAEARDPKGLYARARRGEIANFTGISSPYESPEAPELRLDTTALSPDAAAAVVVERLREAGRLGI